MTCVVCCAIFWRVCCVTLSDCIGCSAVQSVVEVSSSGGSVTSSSSGIKRGSGAGGKAAGAAVQRRVRDVREPSLSVSFPSKVSDHSTASLARTSHSLVVDP